MGFWYPEAGPGTRYKLFSTLRSSPTGGIHFQNPNSRNIPMGSGNISPIRSNIRRQRRRVSSNSLGKSGLTSELFSPGGSAPWTPKLGVFQSLATPKYKLWVPCAGYPTGGIHFQNPNFENSSFFDLCRLPYRGNPFSESQL